jgi:xylan 1,4-beta-xylosidase
MTTNPENAYRNGTMYSSYTAASFARIYDLAERYKVNLRGAISWSFEFEDQKWFDGFRDLATNGVDKPVLNVFRMYGKMEGRRVTVVNPGEIGLDSLMAGGVHGPARDIHALASIGEKSMSVMVWNYHDDDLRGEESAVRLSMTHLPFQSAVLQTYVIDEDHSNAYTAWQRMGSPQQPTSDQYAALEKAGGLAESGVGKKLTQQQASGIGFRLPLHGVILLRWTW